MTHNSQSLHSDIPKPEASSPSSQTLCQSVEKAMTAYFEQLEGQDITQVYQMVMNEVEKPMLQVVMRFCRDNQSKASQVLGLNRGTLRKKLKQYNML